MKQTLLHFLGALPLHLPCRGDHIHIQRPYNSAERLTIFTQVIHHHETLEARVTHKSPHYNVIFAMALSSVFHCYVTR